MARPTWTGTISFGLLHIPVQMYTGARSTGVSFRMVDKRDMSPIRYERVNATTGRRVEWGDIGKAFEYEKDAFVLVDEKELRKALPEKTETIDIVGFVEKDAIGPRYFETPYWLAPGKKAEKGYVLLRETLERTGRVAIAKIVLRTRQYLCCVMPEGNGLVLDVLRYSNELVPASGLALPGSDPADYRITKGELDMARQLIESMDAKWKPEEFTDDFEEQLMKVIDALVAAEQGGAKPRRARKSAEPTSNVVDFMALLKKSLETHGGGARTGGAGADGGRKAPRKRASAAKGPAKKRASR